MQAIRGDNVNTIFYAGVHLLRRYGQMQNSRAGDVVVAPFPVMSIYVKPCQRVLFDPYRDANPFFHLMEALWMLAGRDDAAFLNHFVKDFGERFAESDGRLHGAYGRRWRGWFREELIDQPAGAAQTRSIDQLAYVIEALRKNPDDRRVVITMWDPEEDLGANKKDLPCNTHVYPRIVSGELDITICCRSNDIIWGAYGANAVHFSVLQEYLAAGIGCGVGKMYQLSNNFHAYLDIFSKQYPHPADPYGAGIISERPLIDDFASFDEEVREFCYDPCAETVYKNRFLDQVAAVMARTYRHYRKGERAAAQTRALEVGAKDWQLACVQWIDRKLGIRK